MQLDQVVSIEKCIFLYTHPVEGNHPNDFGDEVLYMIGTEKTDLIGVDQCNE